MIIDDWADRRGSAPRVHADICPEADWHEFFRAARHLQTSVARQCLRHPRRYPFRCTDRKSYAVNCQASTNSPEFSCC